MEMLYEKILDDLLINQDKLTKTERVKVFVTLSNYIFPKTKSVRDKFTLEKLKEKNGMKNNYQYRQFLIKNGVSLMNKNNVASCHECSECVLQGTSNDKSYGKYLFTSI